MEKTEQQRRDDYYEGRAWRELSRSNYLVIQKRILCSMPAEWQERFFDMLEEVGNTLDIEHGNVCGYQVRPYSDFTYNESADPNGQEEFEFCIDPLAEYRHTGPLPLKDKCHGKP
jgi:hypothetical protein